MGVAYVLIAVLLPLGLFVSGKESWPPMKPIGLTFAGLAGVAGAIGALCVIFASKAAGGPKAKEYLYIAPLIFGLAPVINTLVSVFWHPAPGQPLSFHVELPGWKLWVGILFVGIGAALVLFSKEETEIQHRGAPKAPAVAVSPVTATRAGDFAVTADQAVERLQGVLAHLWMVRTFLKHAEEIENDEQLLDVPRTLFDYIRAVEPAAQRNDSKEYLHRIRGKLPKLRRAAELLQGEYRRVSAHTNFEMAALSLATCVRQIEEILAAVQFPV